MARPAFSANLQVRQQYLSLLYHKTNAEVGWTLLDQGKSFQTSVTADTKDYKRLGDKYVKTVGGSTKVEVTLTLYTEANLDEVARALGVIRPGAGWLGTEQITLDPTVCIGDFKEESYSGTAVGVDTPVHIKYIDDFYGTSISDGWDADGDVRTIEIKGTAARYYMTPVVPGS